MAYLAMARLLVQVAETVLPIFEVSAWVLKSLVILLLIGFPIALFAAWVFELTPEGLKRTEELPPQYVTAQVTDAATDRYLWANSADKPLCQFYATLSGF